MTTKRQHDKAGSPRTARGSETGSGTGSDTAARSAAVEHLRSLRALLVALPPAVTEAEAVDRLRALEELKASCAAAQAREADRFTALRREAEAERGVPARERGRGVAAEVALARRESPHRGSRHLGLATALVREMPHTLTALSEGRISEEHATRSAGRPRGWPWSIDATWIR